MKALILLTCVTLTLLGCDNKSLGQQRAERTTQAKGELVIAVAWPLNSSKAALVKGVDLAVEEVNRNGGLLGGRKIKIILKDDAESQTTGRLVAQEIADNLDVSAVIGHLNTYIAASASQIYERAGLVMITPGASGQKITAQGGKFAFRSLPGNRDQGRQIGDYAAAQGYKNIAIYYIKNDYGIDLANFFEQRASELGITITDRRSYNKGVAYHGAVLSDWHSFLKLDAIFLVGSLPESADILREIRLAGLTIPVFGGAGLDSPQLIQQGGASVEGTVVFSLFNIGDTRPEVLSFSERYRSKYGIIPDSSAAQGYDAMNLLVHAISTAQSAAPEKIASVLHNTKNWHGVTGSYTFNEQGELASRPMAKVIVKNGKFVFFDSKLPN